MEELERSSGFGVWAVDGYPLRIEYSAVVMEELRAAASEGLQRLSRGGIEVGGVLYGTRQGDAIRILSWRPIPCSHARGPGFLLSEKDEAALQQLLDMGEEDPELKGLFAVGWFVSHTRSGLLLSEADLLFYQDFFPESWQVTLVLHPSRYGPAQAGFFFREPDGKIRSESSHKDFTVEPIEKRRERRRDYPPRPAASAVVSGVSSDERAVMPATPVPAPAPAPVSPENSMAMFRTQEPGWFARHWKGMFGALILAAAAFASGFYLRPERPALEPLSPAISLRAEDRDGQLHIAWDRESLPVREAVTGILTIKEGRVKQEISLDAEQIRFGSFTYARRAEEVEVGLSVQSVSGSQVTELTRFLGQPSRPAREAAEATRRIEEQRKEIDTLYEDLRLERLKTARLERLVQILQDRLRIAGQ